LKSWPGYLSFMVLGGRVEAEMYRRILVPLDGSELAECVLPHVENVVRNNPGAEVVLFRVCEPPVILADYPPNLQTAWEDHVREETAHIQQQCRLYLGEIEKRLAKMGLNVTSAAGLGSAPEQIVDYAVQHQIDLIIISSHGHSGVTRWAYGNTTSKVLQATSIPVMLIKPAECQNQ
jgi:nucleotide-binding universal stress UspA family protein